MAPGVNAKYKFVSDVSKHPAIRHPPNQDAEKPEQQSKPLLHGQSAVQWKNHPRNGAGVRLKSR